MIEEAYLYVSKINFDFVCVNGIQFGQLWLIKMITALFTHMITQCIKCKKLSALVVKN